jgi:hypothetical protein
MEGLDRLLIGKEECCTNKNPRGVHELFRSVYRQHAVTKRTCGHVMFPNELAKMAANATIRFPTSLTTIKLHASYTGFFSSA